MRKYRAKIRKGRNGWYLGNVQVKDKWIWNDLFAYQEEFAAKEEDLKEVLRGQITADKERLQYGTKVLSEAELFDVT